MSRLPLCLIITGRPGAGKTTLANLLAAELHLPLVSRDALKEGYVRSQGRSHRELPPETNGLVTDHFFVTLQQHLSAGISLIAEAAFQHRVWASRLPDIQAIGQAICVVCTLDESLAAERHLQRGLHDPWREYFHGDLNVTNFRESGVMAPPAPYQQPELDIPTLAVNTASAYSPPLVDIVAFVQARYG